MTPRGTAARGVLLVALVLTASCGRRATAAERRRVICMTKAIEQGELPVTSFTLAQLRDACGPAFGPHFEAPALGTSHPANPIDRWKYFADHGDLLCSRDRAGQLRPLQWQKLLAECGRDHFAVPAGLEPFFSESWYVGQRIGAWLAGQSKGDQNRTGWDAFYRRAAEGSLALEYPLSAPGLYTLPGSATSSFDPGTRSLHVVVLADRLLVGAAPRLRLVPAGVAPLMERFPGEAVEVAGLAGALAGAPAATLIAPRELPAARLFEVLAALPPQIDARLLVAAQGLRAVVHRVPLAALDGARRGELSGKRVDDVARALDAIERSHLGTPAPGKTRAPTIPRRPVQ